VRDVVSVDFFAKFLESLDGRISIERLILCLAEDLVEDEDRD